MLHNEPFIVRAENEEAACYMNPQAFFMCPKCFKSHQFQASGSIILKKDSLNTIRMQVVPKVVAECDCGFIGEFLPIGSQFTTAVELLSKKGYVIELIEEEELICGNTKLLIKFKGDMNFPLIPVGWQLVDNQLVGHGPEEKLIENLNAWAKLLPPPKK